MNPLYKCNRCAHLAQQPRCCGEVNTTKLTDRNIAKEDPIYLAKEIHRLLTRAEVMEDALHKIKFNLSAPYTPSGLASATFDKLLEL